MMKAHPERNHLNARRCYIYANVQSGILGTLVVESDHRLTTLHPANLKSSIGQAGVVVYILTGGTKEGLLFRDPEFKLKESTLARTGEIQRNPYT